jgi:hypothetical protein
VNAQPTIVIDDETTWPPELRQAFESALCELRRYEEIRAEHDKRAETDLGFRLSRPTNPCRPTKDRVVMNGNGAMAGQSIITADRINAIHCLGDSTFGELTQHLTWRRKLS